jgi:hypothetical protein
MPLVFDASFLLFSTLVMSVDFNEVCYFEIFRMSLTTIFMQKTSMPAEAYSTQRLPMDT